MGEFFFSYGAKERRGQEDLQCCGNSGLFLAALLDESIRHCFRDYGGAEAADDGGADRGAGPEIFGGDSGLSGWVVVEVVDEFDVREEGHGRRLHYRSWWWGMGFLDGGEEGGVEDGTGCAVAEGVVEDEGCDEIPWR